MTKAEILRKEILRQYKSVRAFALEMGIPYSTLATALERGVEGMAYGTVMKICEELHLNPVDFSYLEQDAALGAVMLENHLSVLRFPQVELEIVEPVFRRQAIGGLGVVRGERLLPLVRNVGDRIFDLVHMNGKRREAIRDLSAGHGNRAVLP